MNRSQAQLFAASGLADRQALYVDTAETITFDPDGEALVLTSAYFGAPVLSEDFDMAPAERVTATLRVPVALLPRGKELQGRRVRRAGGDAGAATYRIATGQGAVTYDPINPEVVLALTEL